MYTYEYIYTYIYIYIYTYIWMHYNLPHYESRYLRPLNEDGGDLLAFRGYDVYHTIRTSCIYEGKGCQLKGKVLKR
jgi:hypothetical protein